jgi:pyruvate,water dikinase
VLDDMSRLVVPITEQEAADASRFGPKAANQAALAQAGLPTPGGYCLDAAAYREQMAALGLDELAEKVFAAEDAEARRAALEIRLGLLEDEIAPPLHQALLATWRALESAGGVPAAVRSSALVEDRYGSSFAGQFESFLGLTDEAEFLTAVRACWTALWAPRALRYMATHNVEASETAMGLLIQPLVQARVSGGGLSRTADGHMVLSATTGLGSTIAQGELVPDRYLLTRDGKLLEAEAGRRPASPSCSIHGAGAANGAAHDHDHGGGHGKPCLTDREIAQLADLLLRAEDVIGGPAEIEWAADDRGIRMLQARPLVSGPIEVPDEIWAKHPRLRGHPAGIGWGTGRARVVNCECELSRVGPGDVLVTRIAGPALTDILQSISGVVAELGGSTSHLASLARERGIPMVLGVMNATRRIPDGSMVAVDGVAGIVRWMDQEQRVG